MAELLLKFAAENIVDLPRPTVSAICVALDANARRAWDDQIATDFWVAFNTLCNLVKPVTVDTLSTNLVAVPPPRWRAWMHGAKPVTLSRRTAKRYLILLIILLCTSVSLGFLVTATSSLSNDVQKLIAQDDELTDRLAIATELLENDMGTQSFALATAKQRLAIVLLQTQLKEQSYVLDAMLQKNMMMSRLLIYGWKFTFTPGDFREATSTTDVRNAIREYQITRRDVAADRLNAQIVVSVITATLLPIILGVMGACAYVMRLISEQIKNSTFSSTAPIRHFVRIALGGLSGVAIGFGGIFTETGLSSSTLAFLAGYAIEPIFTAFDSFADKFHK